MYVYEEMVDVLYQKFPELLELYKDEVEYCRDIYEEYGDELAGPQAYSHYENIFNYFIADALTNEPDGSPLLKRIFDFFEEMATHEDVGGVGNLLQVALLENIWSIGYKSYIRATSLMQPETLKLSKQLSRYLREPKPE